jgi:lipopolysaccharide export system protein LptA
MTALNKIRQMFGGHRIIFLVILCLFGLCAMSKGPKKHKRRKTTDERVYLIHADVLHYDQYGSNAPGAQVLNGNVKFRHKGATLSCDSAFYYEKENSFEAYGHVRMTQGDTLTLTSEEAYYDGNDQMAEARYNVVLKHRGTTLYTDSLNYDRLYNVGYFFEGGRMVDKKNTLVADWGEYNTETHEAIFNYDVTLRNEQFTIYTDTLHYDTRTSLAHVVGPSRIVSGQNTINTESGYYNSNTGQTQLYGRSTVVNDAKEMTADSLFYNENTGVSEGFNHVVYVDKENKNSLDCDYFWYNDSTGEALATDRALLKEFSQKDTLYVHSDTIRMFSYNLNTDSVYRTAHCYNRVRAYRTDIQAVCDSLVYITRDSCMTMYKDPIVWNMGRQMVGEKMEVFMKDSTVERAHVIGQAFSIEMLHDSIHYNQVSSREMFAYFDNGDLRKTEAIGNVRTVYYPIDEKDSSLILLNYLETDTMRMFLAKRQLEKIWTSKAEGTGYPMSQIPPGMEKLTGFAWFDNIRPVDKYDIFNWRGKKEEDVLKPQTRHAAPLQQIKDGKVETLKGEEIKL